MTPAERAELRKMAIALSERGDLYMSFQIEGAAIPLLDAADTLDEVIAGFPKCDQCDAPATLWGPLETRCDTHRGGAAVADSPNAHIIRRWGKKP